MSQESPVPPNQYDSFADKYLNGLDKKPHNAFYERPAMIQMMPDVRGKTVLDAGCGNGWYAEHLLEAGANVTVVDASEKMLENVQVRTSGKVECVLWDLNKPLTWAKSDSFDFVFSSLTLHYLQNWTIVLSEFSRVLRHSGRLLFSIHHPFADWQIFRKENYFATTKIEDDWGFPVHFYRRSLSAIMDAVIDAGFQIEKLIEPFPTEEFLKIDPNGHQTLTTSPLFLILLCRKP